MAKDKTPILDLSTLEDDRPPIRIDGVVYHLKCADELSLMDSHWFSARAEELSVLSAGNDMPALELLLRTIVKRAVVDATDEVLAKLSGSQNMAIVEVFTGLLMAKRISQAGALARIATPQTGANSSLGSSTSMAAILAAGSTIRPPASSGLA